MAEKISIAAFRELFKGDVEFAVIDPRAPDDFVQGHLLAAANLPSQHLPSLISDAVGRSATLCVLCDDESGAASEAARQLEALGYDKLAILAGGIEAWRQSGGAVFSGRSVPGKAFGEFIEKTCGTPAISAAELHHRIKREHPLLLVDARSREEHASYCIPGASLCPGAELIYRVLPQLTPQTEVVVHCGGRTRGIIGAQTLIDAGCNNVHVLENGTMAWQFEQLELETGSQAELPAPRRESLIMTRAVADLLAERWHIDRLDSIPRHDQRHRYLIDIRSREEYLEGHIAGSRHVPGGHLLQHVERYLVVRNSVVVLIDSDWVRAVTSAVWLRRMGWRRVYVFTIDARRERLETGPGSAREPREERDPDPDDYPDRAALLAANRAYLDWEIALYDQLAGDPAAPYMN